MSNLKSEEQTSVPDSEASVDYYVTTVNGQAPTKTVKDSNSKNTEETTPIVVSVDRAGSVKVRVRKKSKRRKKKSNLALEESGFHVSDDGVLLDSSCSDENRNKVPRRSSSLSEKDLRRNSARLIGTGVPPLNEGASNLADFVVRRRVKKKPSLSKANTRRRGVILDDITLDQPSKTESKNTEVTPAHTEPAKLPAAHKQLGSVKSSDSTEAKRLNRQDALATLNAFMVEVKEATSVAKQQEGERRKDPMLRKSRSLNQLVDISDDGNCMEANDYLSLLEQVKLPAVSFPTYSHQKSTSFDRQSAVSGSVFVSDLETSMDSPVQHSLLVKTSSEESRGDQQDEVPVLELLSRRLSGRTDLEKMPTRGFSQSNLTKRKDLTYGISHLEHVLRLLEQIGDLRKRNHVLVKRVQQLESEVKTLKEDKGVPLRSLNSELNLAELYRNLNDSKRPRTGRFKGVISRTNRKSSWEKNHDTKGISQPMMLGITGNATDKTSTAAISSQNRLNDPRVIHSNLSLRRRKKQPYSRDDLDLSTKNKLKFWKTTANRNPAQQISKNQILSTIKSENSQGTAVHLKSASVTLDKLLNNVDENFTQKLVEWQKTSGKSGRDSVASDTAVVNQSRNSRPLSVAAFPLRKDSYLSFKSHQKSNDNKNTAANKETLVKKLTKWEKVAARRLSKDNRSRSFDRMSESEKKDVPSVPRTTHNRSKSASADFHKSLPCVLPASSGLSHLVHLRQASAHHTSGSAEWSGLQKTFPTSFAENKPLPRMGASGHSRLASPLRKLKGGSKRNTWSHAKFAGNFYLPNSDFMLTSNLKTAGTIGDQLTLQLDQDDVKGATSTGSKNKELIHSKRKMHDGQVVRKKGKIPPSPLARYQKEHGARSFRRSNQVEILRLSSCELLASSPIAPDVKEETNSSSLHQSLPNLAKNITDGHLDNSDNCENSRRFTVTVIDLKKFKSKNRAVATRSAPSLVKKSSSTNLNLPMEVRRSSSCRDFSSEESKSRRGVSRQTWVTTSLLKSRRKDAIISTESTKDTSLSLTPPLPNTAAKYPGVSRKKKTKTEKMLNLIFPLSRSSSFRSVRSNESHVDSQLSPRTPPTRKKSGRIFSFRSKSPSKHLNGDSQKVKLRANTDAHSLSSWTFDTASDASDKSNQLGSAESEQTSSNKIGEVSRHLTDDGSITAGHLISPAPISKGIVSRLSKRFARRDKEKEERAVSQLSTTQSKSVNFLNAKSRFEMKNNNENSKAASLGRNFNYNNNCSIVAA